MSRLPLALRGKHSREYVRHQTVHVPFNVVYALDGKDLSHGVLYILHNFRVGKVQYHLVSTGSVLPPRDPHGIFGMRPEKIAVFADHLGFHPDAEIKAQVMNFGSQAFNTVR